MAVQAQLERGRFYLTALGCDYYFPREEEIAQAKLPADLSSQTNALWGYSKNENEWVSYVLTTDTFFVNGIFQTTPDDFSATLYRYNSVSGEVKNRMLARRIYHIIKKAEQREKQGGEAGE